MPRVDEAGEVPHFPEHPEHIGQALSLGGGADFLDVEIGWGVELKTNGDVVGAVVSCGQLLKRLFAIRHPMPDPDRLRTLAASSASRCAHRAQEEDGNPPGH